MSAWISVSLPGPGERRGRAGGLEGGAQVFLSGPVGSALLSPWDIAGDWPHTSNAGVCRPPTTAGGCVHFPGSLRTKSVLTFGEVTEQETVFTP